MKKDEVITFKVSEQLAGALRKLPNRSEFIRSAVLNALENACPLCGGTGILTPEQQTHWTSFTEKHTLSECDDCSAVHLICEAE